MLVTASVVAVVFFFVYIVVQTAIYQDLDGDLAYEARKHTQGIVIIQDSILFVNENEWQKREHWELEVDPVFVQYVSEFGKPMAKSPNLKGGTLIYHPQKRTNTAFNTEFNYQAIRQIQTAIRQNGNQKGYILTAMSLEGALDLLESLGETLATLFPIVLLGVFFIARFIAKRSIMPVKVITKTADRITRNNINERVPLPENKDELYDLTASINELLDRIQNAIEREKQFTADASHQLRTPLAVLKGTLEVLLRKPRREEEYQEKIRYSIREIDHISEIVDQLLILARFDKVHQKINKKEVDLHVSVDDILHRFKNHIQKKALSMEVQTSGRGAILSDAYYIDLILENIISNAIKYSYDNSKIEISLFAEDEHIICRIQDFGIGISPEDQNKVFNPFFRSHNLKYKNIKGNGLGLSIVKKASEILNVHITLESDTERGAIFSLSFPIG